MQHQRRHQRRLPVVDVNHFRSPRQIARQMRDALGEKNEPFRVVGVIDAVFLINSAPIK